MFIGTFFQNLDQKGRVCLPPKFKETILSNYSGSLVISYPLFIGDDDNYICVYPREEWNKIIDKLRVLPTDKPSIMYIRSIISGALECNIDNSGRILIPSNPREFGNIKKEVALLGMSNRVEIWDRQKYESEVVGKRKEVLSKPPEKLVDIGFL